MRHTARLGVLALVFLALACQAPASRPAAGPSQSPNAGGSPASGASSPPGAAGQEGAVSGGPAAAVAPASAAPPTPVSLRYAYSATSIVFLAQKLAQEQGIYREHGLDMEQVLMGAGVMAAAQLAGEVDYTNSYPATIHSAAQGAPLRIVSTVVDAPLFAYMARPEIQSLADLRGKAVGITTRGGAVDKVTRALLAQQGMDADTDVTILPAGGQVTVLLDALLSGRVQGAALSAPWYVRARDQGMRLLVKAPEVLHEPQNGLAVTTDRLAQQRDQVRRVVAAETQAVRYMKENRAATVALARDWLEISQADAEESYDFALPAFIPDGRIDVPGLVRYVADEKADGTLPADFQVESLLDTNLAEEALRALDRR
ncbi:MAG TPA: ABC transporter substrate-binding protein [Chloroflexota bacterium]|nr:ABC transporter substrate-binding protein [Chloroflexota bacterium]